MEGGPAGVGGTLAAAAAPLSPQGGRPGSRGGLGPLRGHCLWKRPARVRHPVTFRRDLGHEPDLTLVPGLGSLVRHSECSDEWLDTKGTCYRPRHAHTLPS